MYGLKAVPFKDSFPSLPGPAERVFNPLYVPAEARKWVPQRLKSLRENSHLPASVPQGRMKLPRTTPISATLFGCFSSNSPQNRHPERSASRIYRVTQGLVARSRRTLRMLILPMLLVPFRPPKPENGICAT